MACFQLYFMEDLSLLEEIKENAMDDAVSVGSKNPFFFFFFSEQ